MLRECRKTVLQNRCSLRIRYATKSVRESRKESADVRIALEYSKHQIAELLETNKHIERSQEFLAEKFDQISKGFEELKLELVALRTENQELRMEIVTCREQNSTLSNRVDILELELDRINRRELSRNAIVLGIPISENENPRVLIQQIGAAVGYNMDDKDIVSAKRLVGNKTQTNIPPMLVVFNSEEAKNNLFEKKRAHGVLKVSALGNLYEKSLKTVTMRDELTTFGKDLLKETKKVQEDIGIKYVWPGRDGKILIRRSDGARVEKIGSKQELLKLMESKKRALNFSSSSSFTMSSPKRHHTQN